MLTGLTGRIFFCMGQRCSQSEMRQAIVICDPTQQAILDRTTLELATIGS